jgi:hypothetical protein
MPVTQADISLKRSLTQSDVNTTNGGPLTTTAVSTSLFPDVTGTERTQGLSRWRKVFVKNEAGTGALPNKYSSATLGLVATKIFLLNNSAAGDYYLIKAADSKSGTQSNEVDSGWSGVGVLEADANLDDKWFNVTCEVAAAAGELFTDGATVLITDGTQREFLVLDSSGGAIWTNESVELNFNATPLQHDYIAKLTATADLYSANTVGFTGAGMVVSYAGKRIKIVSGTGAGQMRRIISNNSTTFTVEYNWTTPLGPDSVYEVYLVTVSQCAELGTINCSYGTPTLDLGLGSTGTFTDANNLLLFPVGCVDDTWTLLFGTPTTFSIAGLRTGGLVGSFAVGLTTKPQNGASFYFEINSAAFGGTFIEGDEITFTTTSSSKAAWIKEVVPPLTEAHLSNSVDIGVIGDTV